MKHGRGAEINEFDDIGLGHHAIVQFEIPVCESHPMEVIDTIDNLPENAINFWPGHLSGHDDTEQIKRRIFHDLLGRQHLVIF